MQKKIAMKIKNKRILLVLPKNRSTVLPALVRVFGYLGWDYQVFDFREFNYSEKVISFLGNRRLANQLLNRRMQQAIIDYRPAIFFTVKGDTVLPETVATVKKVGGISINWFPEDFRFYDLSKALSRYYDIFLYAESFMIPYLKRETGKEDVYHLPFGADILPTDPLPPVLPKIYNLTIVGTAYPVRVDLLPTISGLGLNIWGDESWSKTKLSSNWHGPSPFENIFEIYGKSKIGINMDYSPIGNSILNRAYEIMESGTFCLARSRTELASFFSIDKEIVAFNSDREFIEKAKYYLRHDTEREKIAKRGYQAVKSRHTYIRRFTELFKELGIQ